MPKKTKVIEVACPKERASVPFEENEPVGAQEVEEVQEVEGVLPGGRRLQHQCGPTLLYQSASSH